MRILLSLLILMLLGIIVLQLTDLVYKAYFWVPIGVFISLTYGTVIGIPLLVSIYGLLPLLFAIFIIGATVYGFIKHKTVIGQVLAVAGVVSWVALVAYGLGHGG